MTNEVKSKVAGAAKSALPWRKGVAWWIVLIEGVVLLALGLYLFFSEGTTATVLGWIVALALAVSGGLSVYAALRTEQKDQVRQWTLIHGGVGLAAGAIVVVMLLFNIGLPNPALIILGVGCLIYGGIGLYLLIDKNLTSLRRVSVIGTIFYLTIGVLVLLHTLGVGTLTGMIALIKLVIIVAGIVLILWALIIKNEQTKGAAARTAA